MLIKAGEQLGDIPTVRILISFHLYMVICPDSAVHYVTAKSQQMPPCQCEA